VIEKGGARDAEEAGELRPGIGLTHVDDANRFDPRPRRLDAIGERGLAGLNAAPEAPLRRYQKMLVERVGGYGHLALIALTVDLVRLVRIEGAIR
jgi:hypothetical protein